MLVTTYNHARFLEQALDSLRHQTSADFEVIITDDASSDGSADIIAAWLARTGFPAQFIRNQVNRGICANRNAALARASGTFVCSLSGDDCYEPDRIERQLACFLAQGERVAVVYSDMLVVDAEGRPCERSFLDRTLNGAPPPQGDLFRRIVAGNFLPAPAMMVRKSAIAAVGGYDESLVYEDLDMWLRLSHRFTFVYLPGLLVRYRTHEASMSNDLAIRPQLHRTYSRMLAKWINAGLDQDSRRVVLNSLLRNGGSLLFLKDGAAARAAFRDVLAVDTRPGRRLLAALGLLPGAGAVVRLLSPFYRIYRHVRTTRSRVKVAAD